MTIDETREQLAEIIGEKREPVREILQGMEAEGIFCIPIEDVRIILTGHCNFMYRLIYPGDSREQPAIRNIAGMGALSRHRNPVFPR